ncbi:hypothetical protein BD324DRAFT_439618 [Kockovaella imperatae]|uniref:Carrier domain-containing protein n=1 Tax=Kockovaella imperatae TaxID=4999 RepID=A0A1Y1UID0_9TREE|nr:hypothetical protein BD324DRAFT_439618 [Kockovaella imperatae]ORX37297.1 hypothetical protein BD324DRAFT_439618 [Kockovaella imperatae]
MSSASAAAKMLCCDPRLEDSVIWPQGVRTLADLFQYQVNTRPDSTLLSFQTPGKPLQTFTYGQARDTGRRAALALNQTIISTATSSTAVRQAPVCGLWFEKSLELHLAMFAVVQSGCTWLGFDPNAPTSRVSVCLEDSQASVIICDQEHHARALEAARGAKGVQVIVKTWSELVDQRVDSEDTLPTVQPGDAAYLIYTSGSTGTPKGISISHSAAVTFALSERTILGTSPSDTVWQGFSPAFDMFIEEVWVSIAGGAQLAVGTRAECQNVPGLGGKDGVWSRRGVTLVNAVPTLISIMTALDSDDMVIPEAVRLVNLGGEACPPALVQRLWRPSLTIVNTYGPSETTVTATYAILKPDEPITIGRPLPFYHAVLLPISEDDEPLGAKPIPMGISTGTEGELCIGGSCLGNGYVNRDELTSQKFIAHPLIPGEKLYRTGDRVRIGPQGDIQFLGRIDAQIKHRGFRIELGEIENVLTSSDIVKTAAVICTEPGTEDAKLEAFVVCTMPRDELDAGKTISSLRETLGGLPSYMQPEIFTLLDADEMPRLPSGKINAKALHQLARNRVELEAPSETTVCDGNDSMTDVEDKGEVLQIMMKELAGMFPQQSKQGRLLPSSDFFLDLGGHSLTAAILVSKLRNSGKGTGLEGIGLQQIYELRTPAAICRYIDEEASEPGTPRFSMTESDVVDDDYRELDESLIPTWKYVTCAICQIPALAILFLIQGLSFMAPYMVFDKVHKISNVGWALACAYGVFVVVPWVITCMGIIGVRALLPVVKPGRYPLYGQFYFRWWFAKKFLGFIDQSTVGETGLYPALLRALGAKVGHFCHIAPLATGPAMSLLSIGNDVVIGKDVMFAFETVGQGYLQLDRIVVEDEVLIESRTVVEGGVVLEAGSELGPMSMVPQGTRIARTTRWTGSPVRFEGMAAEPFQGKPTRPSMFRYMACNVTYLFLSTFILPLLYYIPQVPSILLFEVLSLRHEGINPWKRTAIVSFPASLAYIIAVIAEVIILRWLVLGRVKAGTYKVASFYMIRIWIVDRLMDMSLAILHPIFASLYVVPFLRALGTKIGRRAEVSTAQGMNFDLVDIGDEAFVADTVLLGESNIFKNELTLEMTRLDSRAFAGNGSLIPQGTVLESNTLVGVMSIPPQTDKCGVYHLPAGQSCFGSPPVVMPNRQAPTTCHADNFLFNPKPSQIAMRAFIEFIRLWLPRLIIILGIGFTLKFWEEANRHHHIGVARGIFLFPVFYLFLFCMPALIFTLLLKWCFVGEYYTVEWPLWSLQVWLSEAVTSIYESLLTPLFMDLFLGTPYCAMVLRLFGTRIGKKVTLLSLDITEFDMVSLGDESVLNAQSGPQTHLFEDRIMKVGHVHLEAHSVLKTASTCLPGSTIGAGSTVGSLSLVMKGEVVPPNQVWEGAPIRRRTGRAGPSKK